MTHLYIPLISEEITTVQPKRADLQGVRGIAILAVLGFHFLPNYFPNGYLGVDQFFVLSGFLMCMLLSKNSINGSTISFILEFYYRRLKRILPLYLLIIALSLVGLFYFFPDTAFETNLISGERSLVFISNRWKTEAEDYFSKVIFLSTAIDIFTHTWSLSVEVQFDFFIPIIYQLIVKTLPPQLEVHSFLLLAMSSYGYSKFFCTENDAFNSPIARMWQFSTGIIVNLISKKSAFEGIHNNGSFKSFIKYSCLISVVFIIGCPIELPAEILR
ncbi:hypothetical protein CRE_06267 [Caenorhabditis remanei]|uniref:Acyltransferase 3 domain-containing protein n=1 Tax=Caenorhabditis remanei TaxID=31234 RepID=E3NVL9_CAERE|nr:hypothetical protein CRE_06267 [Caenorhabditis remanei]